MLPEVLWGLHSTLGSPQISHVPKSWSPEVLNYSLDIGKQHGRAEFLCSWLSSEVGFSGHLWDHKSTDEFQRWCKDRWEWCELLVLSSYNMISIIYYQYIYYGLYRSRTIMIYDTWDFNWIAVSLPNEPIKVPCVYVVNIALRLWPCCWYF